jgi:acetyltransferase
VHDSVDVSCRCLSVLAQYGRFRSTFRKRTSFVFKWGAGAKREATRILASAREEGRRALLEHEAKRLLALHGAPVTADQLAASASQAARIAGEMKGPVALKICSPEILHKSDAGGVRLGLRGRQAVAGAFGEILESARRYRPEADIRGCVVSPMSPRGVETILGTKIDPQFGPVIMFGIGGILVEVVRDVVFRVLPISRRAAREMISEIRAAPVLNGCRGEPPADREALVDLLLTVSAVVEAYPAIEEMDLNPVIVHEKGLSVVDARILLRKNARQAPRW